MNFHGDVGGKAATALLAFFLIASVPRIRADSTPPILLEERFDSPGSPSFKLEGNASVINFGKLEGESGGNCVKLDSAPGDKSGGLPAGAIKFIVRGLGGSEGKWFRVSFHGLAAKDFRVKQEADLAIRVKFYGKNGTEPLDGVVKEIYRDIEGDRRDIEANGDGFHFGSTAWMPYVFDFRLPFNAIDTLELSVAFQNGEGHAPYGSFFVDDVKMEKIDIPLNAEEKKSPLPPAIDEANLLPIGGRWFYQREKNEVIQNAPRHFDSSNLNRLVYKTGNVYEIPFADACGAWLRRGFKDAQGRIAPEDEWLNNTVTVDFQGDTMVLHSLDIPNHPTGGFPGYLGNPNYIQEQDIVAYIPMNPTPNPRAVAMTFKNGNRALPMGPTGIATNGVVFYNPFDAGMEEAVGIMDRCCGHPDQRNRYHYHKYPVCARSPFEDKGEEHSHLIGWAFDGFPIYGPYEGKGELAMDSKTNPLNAFNVHYDKDRGWHYHVTPGKFPYLFGGYWGVVDSRDLRRGPPPPNP